MKKEKVLILGATGMLGSTLFRRLKAEGVDVLGTERQSQTPALLGNVDVMRFDTVSRVLDETRPSTLVNCVGVIRQRPDGQDPLVCIPINSLLPHQLSRTCKERGIRLVHFSTDCVFSGRKGTSYQEEDFADANDVYGRTKYLGEVSDTHAVTLRTSIIGHEARGKLSLVEWFLRQKGTAKGYRQAIYSGLPTVEIANILSSFVLPNRDLSGLYQVSSDPISKFDLLKKISEVYRLNVEVQPDDVVKENKTLDSTRFRKQTGWQPPAWDRLIQEMYADFRESSHA